jgi:gamma-butyrobetaine dioxygenase
MSAIKEVEEIIPVSVEPREKLLVIKWDDGRQSLYPYIYLRDNCPSIRHRNGQKLIETATLRLSVHPETILPQLPEGIHIKWDDGHDSYYPAAWLQQHDLSPAAVQSRREHRKLENVLTQWDASIQAALPKATYRDIVADQGTLHHWLGYVHQYGFAVLQEVPPEENKVLDVIGLFGYTRETNYGKLFDVKTVVNPNNLAYTNLGISPHTDNPYRDPVPTLQLLHCLRSSAFGGDTILVDGRKIALTLKDRSPLYYELLTRTMVTFRFEDNSNLLEYTGPILLCHPNGDFRAIRFNNRSIQPVELSAAEALVFYEAYMTLAAMLEEPQYQVRFRMEAGDLYIVDNERVLHARSAFDDIGGERWLQGAYADRDGLISTWKTGIKNQ